MLDFVHACVAEWERLTELFCLQAAILAGQFAVGA